jgi:hypothetical protein
MSWTITGKTIRQSERQSKEGRQSLQIKVLFEIPPDPLSWSEHIAWIGFRHFLITDQNNVNLKLEVCVPFAFTKPELKEYSFGNTQRVIGPNLYFYGVINKDEENMPINPKHDYKLMFFADGSMHLTEKNEQLIDIKIAFHTKKSHVDQ